MKSNFLYNINVVYTLLKKGFYKVLFIFFIFLSLIVINIFLDPTIITHYSLEFALGILFQENFLAILWLLFQVLITMYFSYLFFFYEMNNSMEFTFLRVKQIPFLINKYFVLEIIVILSRIILYFFLYGIFFNNLEFDSISFGLNILPHFLISSMVFIFNLFLFKKNS